MRDGQLTVEDCIPGMRSMAESDHWGFGTRILVSALRVHGGTVPQSHRAYRCLAVGLRGESAGRAHSARDPWCWGRGGTSGAAKFCVRQCTKRSGGYAAQGVRAASRSRRSGVVRSVNGRTAEHARMKFGVKGAR